MHFIHLEYNVLDNVLIWLKVRFKFIDNILNYIKKFNSFNKYNYTIVNTCVSMLYIYIEMYVY